MSAAGLSRVGKALAHSSLGISNYSDVFNLALSAESSPKTLLDIRRGLVLLFLCSLSIGIGVQDCLVVNKSQVTHKHTSAVVCGARVSDAVYSQVTVKHLGAVELGGSCTGCCRGRVHYVCVGRLCRGIHQALCDRLNGLRGGSILLQHRCQMGHERLLSGLGVDGFGGNIGKEDCSIGLVQIRRFCVLDKCLVDRNIAVVAGILFLCSRLLGLLIQSVVLLSLASTLSFLLCSDLVQVLALKIVVVVLSLSLLILA
ncbi:hypothetical protein HG530_004706 [Fusarium avenaceum]|nr:hypothetical protein HG530_004706 [Fusarium avenaceum]